MISCNSSFLLFFCAGAAAAAPLVLHTSLKTYTGMAVFVQQLPRGATGTNASNPVLPGDLRVMDPGNYPPVVAFPAFTGGRLQTLRYLTWQSRMINAEWGSNVTRGPAGANEPLINGRGLQGPATTNCNIAPLVSKRCPKSRFETWFAPKHRSCWVKTTSRIQQYNYNINNYYYKQMNPRSCINCMIGLQGCQRTGRWCCTTSSSTAWSLHPWITSKVRFTTPTGTPTARRPQRHTCGRRAYQAS